MGWLIKNIKGITIIGRLIKIIISYWIIIRQQESLIKIRRNQEINQKGQEEERKGWILNSRKEQDCNKEIRKVTKIKAVIHYQQAIR